jgi:predicted DNA-binding transcriptional regulator YafY
LKQIKSAQIIERETEHFDDSNFDGDARTVKIKISSDDSDFMRANQSSLTKIQEDMGTTTFEIKVFQPEWIVRSVISEPDTLVLAEPGELRQAIVERCATALDQYGVIG